MKIAVIGLGFVGLSLSSVLASRGITTIGIDSDRKKCSKIAKGIPTFFEPNLEKTLKKALKKNLCITEGVAAEARVDLVVRGEGPLRLDGPSDRSGLRCSDCVEVGCLHPG